jgi:hypothetical protein
MVHPFVLLPLYLYPSNSAWNDLTSSIAANPNLQFQIVIAPNLNSTYPDENYQAGLTSLNSFTNVQTLGYVYTSWAGRNISTVEADINTYAGWTALPGADIGVSGIFFDEAPSEFTSETSSYMKSITSFARKALGRRTQITFNPGVPVDASFYEIADTVNIFEDGWDAFNLTTLDVVDWDILAKSTYLVHSFTGDEELQADLISNLTDSNVGGMLITTQPDYSAFSDLWAEFCEGLSDYEYGTSKWSK